jgi:predicted TIM-barrel fold metal-dependent hydrolase
LRPAIDAHHHLWELGRFPYRWLAPDAPPRPFGDHGPLKRDYRLADYLADIEGAGIVGSVFVEANSDAQDAAEIEWIDAIAQPDFPKAAVGRLDLRRPDAASVLDGFCRSPRMRGIRMSVCWDERPRWRFIDRPDVMLMPEFRAGLAAMTARGLVLDILVVPGQLAQLAELARAHPDQTIVLDHLGSPAFESDADREVWRDGMRACAACPNISVKISALWTIDRAWRPDRIREPVRFVLALFGPERCLWASNYPVEKLMCPIRDQLAHLREVLADLSDDEQNKVFVTTAAKIYRLEIDEAWIRAAGRLQG